jgi:hypothetical protein
VPVLPAGRGVRCGISGAQVLLKAAQAGSESSIWAG